jgi:HPt (histidine-containing phosphotransfer) domain-containing protein
MSKIDLSYLQLVSDGDVDFVNQFIETFENSSYPLADKMESDFANDDLGKLSKAAHQLKPSAKMLKLECSTNLEEIQNEPEKATKEIIRLIQKECREAIDQLKEWQKSL